MMRMMADLGSIVMLEPPEGSARWNEIRDHIDELTLRLDEAVRGATTRSATEPSPAPNLLSRLAGGVARGAIDHAFVRRYVTGVTAAGTATIVRAATHVIDQLLRRPEALNGAQQLAAELTRAMAAMEHPASSTAQVQAVESLRSQLLQVIYEALRFRPVLPLLVRYCPRDALLAKGTSDARMAPAGATVVAAPIAAMFDPERFPRPWRFCACRPLESYVHFGVGPRKCFGQYVVNIALIEIVRTVLVLEGLERKPGPPGRISYDGPVPTSLVVTFKDR
jgi:cytochrome P450